MCAVEQQKMKNGMPKIYIDNSEVHAQTHTKKNVIKSARVFMQLFLKKIKKYIYTDIVSKRYFESGSHRLSLNFLTNQDWQQSATWSSTINQEW